MVDARSCFNFPVVCVSSMSEVEQLYQQCADLSDVVRPIKDVNRRHQQV